MATSTVRNTNFNAIAITDVAQFKTFAGALPGSGIAAALLYSAFWKAVTGRDAAAAGIICKLDANTVDILYFQGSYGVVAGVVRYNFNSETVVILREF